MRRLNHSLTMAACALTLMMTGLQGAVAADTARTLNPEQKKAVQSLIRQYLLENPEIVAEAIEALQEKRKVAEQVAVRAALTSNRSRLFDDPSSPVGGNAKGDVTVVEFFDYRCGVCKRVHPIVSKLIEDDRKIRRVFKEWPILGPDSVFAARAALASRAQEKYFVFHDALMEARSNLNRDAVLATAERVGIDRERLLRDMESPEIARILQRNFRLAEALKLNGTPSFIVGEEVVRGGRDLASMRQLVAEARKQE